MPRKPHRGRAMLPVGPRVGQGIEIQRTDFPLPAGPQPHMDLHLVPGRTGDLALLPGIADLCGPSGLHGHKGRVDIAGRRLLGPESAADPGLFHPDAALGEPQCIGQDPSGMKDDLGR